MERHHRMEVPVTRTAMCVDRVIFICVATRKIPSGKAPVDLYRDERVAVGKCQK